MTTAKLNPGKAAVYEKVLVTPEVPETVELSLTRKDAEVLTLITAVIGGSPEGLRGSSDRIHAALRSAGIREYGAVGNEPLLATTSRAIAEHGRNIYFKV